VSGIKAPPVRSRVASGESSSEPEIELGAQESF